MAEKKEKFNFPHYVYNKIDSAYIPSKVYISLKQDGHEPCNALINIGDSVTEGTLLATGKNGTTPIHSPIPGIVTAFKTSSMPDGTTAECMVIELNGSFTFEGKEKTSAQWRSFDSSKLISQIKNRGIINTFDNSHCSLAWQIDEAGSLGKTLGVRLFDFDSSTSVDKTVARLYKNDVFEGARICAQAMNADGIVFFYCSNNGTLPDASELEVIFKDFPFYFIKTNSNLYPSASHRELQKLIKKYRHTIPECISADIKIYINATTALSVYRSISRSLPVMETLVEINGSALHENRILWVKIGTSIRKLLEECGGTEKKPAKIVANGLLKGVAVAEIDIPVTKYLKSITFLSSNTLPDQKTSLCIHCGFCRKACPIGLLPDMVYCYYANKTSVPKEILSSVHLCDECALCNTACPTRLPLFQIISLVKDNNNNAKNI